jgi:hypothetical protein
MIGQYAQGPRDNQMKRLGFPDALGRLLKTFYQIRWSTSSIVGIRRQYMNAAFVEHALGPVFWLAPKGSGQGTSGYLHPNTAIGQLPDHRILLTYPPQPFRMRENRVIAGHHHTEKHLVRSGGRDMMRRLNENVTRVGERKKAT